MSGIARTPLVRSLRRHLQGNWLVLAVLRSPVHRLLSGMVVELRYKGRRSGREYVLPVEYVRTREGLLVRPQNAGRTSWWRNFATPMPVTVRLAGHVRRGTARVVAPGDPSWDEARQQYASGRRRRLERITGPLVVISIAAGT